MSNVRVDDLDDIKTGIIMANARQRHEYNSSIPTLRGGDPGRDLKGPLVAVEEMVTS